ncbi:hypothetical protein [Dactylosporangium sp. CA-139066]|uniref:hypothetical protein n=1 Tax=Dactylosporangium sp. CA-139066 TaxID=3239930 RepID=UPI003D93AC9B
MHENWWLVRLHAAPTGITLAAGSAAVVATALFAAAATAPSQPVARLVAMALCVAAIGAFGGNLAAALATAGIAWSVLDGFLVNRLGELTWHGPADVVRLGVLAGVAVAGWLGARSHRAARHRRHVVRMRAWLHGEEFASTIRAHKEASPSG